MKKIRNRAYFVLLIALGLFFGLCIFAARLFSDGRDWVMLRANQNVFNEGRLGVGTLVDRGGVILASASGGRYSFAGEAELRAACLHAVGDYEGNIGSGALSVFADKLAGYDPINGVAALSGNGSTVRLSIDSSLNAAAYRALNGRRGAVLVSDYKTGEILCMVSSPSYDPADPPELSAPQYEGVFMNRCLGAAYTPGSVFKLVTLAAAVENIPDLYRQTFDCTGSVNVGGELVRCTGVHGRQTIEQALANSCNVTFSELSQVLGADTIYAYAEKFGFLSSLEVSGVASAEGSVEKAGADTGALSWMGIGQHKDLVSPIAMLRFISAIANGGLVREPVLLKGAYSGRTRLLETEVAEKLRDLMSYNVAYAYGQENFPNLKLCAKTGTAELGDGSSHAWFVGFLDDSENPLAFTVLIEKGGGGLANAGPVANAVLQAAVGGT